MESKLYKYIIIHKVHGDVLLKNSYREISEFINLIYPSEGLSHNAVGERLREKKFFNHYDLLIKELIWS